MLKKSIWALVMIFAWFAIVTPPEPFADDNTQAWYYVNVSLKKVILCPV